MFVSESVTKDLIGVFIGLFVVIIGYYKWIFQYWKRKNFPYLEPSIPFGNLVSPLKKKISFGMTMWQHYKEMRKNRWKHGGIFFMSRPVYYVLDLDYIKNVLSKDFQYFVDRGIYYNEKDDPISGNLFALGGIKWRNLRAKLTPTFTSGKMKMMLQTIIDCEESLLKRINEQSLKNDAIDIKEALACFTTDVIGSCAFGLECHTFSEENSAFRVYGKKILSNTPFELIKRLFATNFPTLARFLAITVTPKDIENFFMNLVKDTVNYREKNNINRKDFMQLLIELKNNNLAEEEGKSLTIEELTAQCVIFFVAGFETSSTTMAFALYELAKNPDIQKRLTNEIESVLAKYDNKITYEALQEMKYMDQVIDETLRKYPPVTFITRECIKDYKIPDEDIIIEKGTTVAIPIYGLHYDEEYFPNPEKFDPERFSEENRNSRHHYAYIPFGEGPRMCIGMRFGLMQSKVGLTSLLKNYNFTVNKKTQEPFEMKHDSFVLAVKDEIWLNAEKL